MAIFGFFFHPSSMNSYCHFIFLFWRFILLSLSNIEGLNLPIVVVHEPKWDINLWNWDGLNHGDTCSTSCQKWTAFSHVLPLHNQYGSNRACHQPQTSFTRDLNMRSNLLICMYLILIYLVLKNNIAADV